MRGLALLAPRVSYAGGMLLSRATILVLVDSIAILLSQACQLARARLASVASPVMRLICQRDCTATDRDLLRRELAIPRASRRTLPPHKRADYPAEQRLAILQIKRHRGWSIRKTARRFVIHPNTLRSWIKAVEGRCLCRDTGCFAPLMQMCWIRLQEMKCMR